MQTNNKNTPFEYLYLYFLACVYNTVRLASNWHQSSLLFQLRQQEGRGQSGQCTGVKPFVIQFGRKRNGKKANNQMQIIEFILIIVVLTMIGLDTGLF